MKVSESLDNVITATEDLRIRSRLFYSSPLNPVAHRKLLDAIENVEAEITKTEPETKFDEIVLDNIKNYKDAMNAFSQFPIDRGEMTIKQSLNRIYGPGVFERLKQDSKNYNWEKSYEINELETKRNKVDPRRFQEDLKQQLNQLHPKIAEYGEKNNLIPEEFQFDVVAIPPSRKQRAFYNPQQKEVNIGVDYFTVTKNNGKIEVDSSNVIYTLFHELIGHAVHQHNSDTIKSPKFTEKASDDIPAKAHIEAVGILSSKHAEKFIERKRDELPITDIGLQIRKSKITTQSKSGPIMTKIYDQMEKRGEIDSAEEKLSQLQSKEWATAALDSWSNRSMNKTLIEASYVAGEKILDEIQINSFKKFTTGAWNPQTLKKHMKNEY